MFSWVKPEKQYNGTMFCVVVAVPYEKQLKQSSVLNSKRYMYILHKLEKNVDYIVKG